jgi:metallo-beta-lactamase family protein
MKIHFFGAAQTVTGSKYLLEINGKRLLLECGFFQGHRKDTYTRNRTFEFEPTNIDAIVLSHAHIDHSGNLPNIVKQGYRGPIFTTPATARLADVMLQDSGHIQESDAAFMNKRHYRRGEPQTVEPIYTLQDAKDVAQHFHPVPYKTPVQPLPGVTVTFFDAGHILGSAGIALDMDENGRKFRLWFSGDIGRPGLPILRDPTLPIDADYLMMENTYGDTPHPDPAQAYVDLKAVLLRTIERHGKVIVPSFAVGRTQEIVFNLNRMMTEGEIPHIPVYVDSPLALAATKVFNEFPDLYDEATSRFIREDRHPALAFKELTYIESVDQSKALNDRHDPMVILAASGMMEAGRILHHLKNNIEDPRNTIMIVSWQSPDTLGRRLAEGDKEVKIFGEWYQVRAEVTTIPGFSAHAGQQYLLKYAQTCRDRQKHIYLVHGEPKVSAVFQQKLTEAGITNFTYPPQDAVIEI